jgi:hypothetical protein
MSAQPPAWLADLAAAGAARVDVEWFAKRLEDFELLKRAQVVAGGDLAVPVGGTRRGGYVSTRTAEEANAVARKLSEHDGYPDVRAHTSSDEDVSAGQVVWGEPVPDCPDIEASDADWAAWEAAAGRLYGYSVAAVYGYVHERYGQLVAIAAIGSECFNDRRERGIDTPDQ